MTGNNPKWKRLGYKTHDEYKAACAATRATRKAALLATRTGLTHKYILEVIWRLAEFDRPECTFTKEQLMAEVGCSLDTVRRALRELRDEGSLFPISVKGGRHIPAKYRLRIAGAKSDPASNRVEEMKAERDRNARWKFLAGKYGALKALEMLEEDEG